MLAGLGVLPGLDVGLGVFGALELDRLSLELSGMLWLPRRKVSDQALPAGGDFTLIGTNLLVCYQPFHALTLGACAGAGARNMRGEGFGVTDPESAQAWWAVAVAEGFAQFQLTRSLALRAAIGTEFPFRPPTFSLAGLGQVHSPGAAGVHASLAFYLRF
jgi:hypothetical protein